MRIPSLTLLGAIAIASSACASSAATEPAAPEPAAREPAAAPPSPSPAVLAQAARADSVRHSWTQADADFVTGMIHHHAQALEMARMAPSHGASPPLLTLTERIINGQKGEILLMQQWLRDRAQPVPGVEGVGDADDANAMDMPMAGPHHGPHMPGMLSPEQLATLDAARGPEWDRLFLTYMIQHHQGAVAMVRELFSTYGAAQSDWIYKIASDISADQSSEVDRMQTMLYDRLFGNGPSR